MKHVKLARASWVLPAIVGACGVALAKLIGLKPSPALEWSLLFLVIAAVCTLFIKMCAARAYRPDRILEIVHALADGHGFDIDKLARQGMDDDVLTAFAELDSVVKSLIQEKIRAKKVLSQIADGIITVDGSGAVILFNKAAESMFGMRTIHTKCGRIEASELHPEIARMASGCIEEKAMLSTEIRLSGMPEKVIGITATPFSEPHSDGVALFLLHDLSEIRRHEKMQKEFVSNVSHELRTPITAVRATAEALIAGAKNDDKLVDRFLNTIVAESDRLSALIDDLLDIAKRDSGITRTEKSKVSVAEVICIALTAARPLADQKNVSVGYFVPDGLAAYASETQLVQLVRNLLDNAIKYTPSGGRVEVIGGQVDDCVTITVRDTGIGIPHGEVDRIFERFYRVDKARSRQLGGTGLGLAIVKDIVEAHGGKVEVETELGNGSAFTVTLPAGSSLQ